MNNEDNIYIILHGFGSYGKEFTVRAKDIFEAIKKGTDTIKQRMLKQGFKEQDGSDVSLRIWRHGE
jgi:hypothetical protein